MSFWMQKEDPEYYTEDEYSEEDWEDLDNVPEEDVPYFGA